MKHEHWTGFTVARTTPAEPNNDHTSTTVVRMTHPRYHVIAVRPIDTTTKQVKPFVMNDEQLIRF